MAAPPGSPDFERGFIEWYVWAFQHVSIDPRRCRAAAWAAVTSTGTRDERSLVARQAAFGPELDELAGKPASELAARAEKAAIAATHPSRPWIRTCGIIAAVLGVILLLAGGACFAIIAISSTTAGQ